MFMNTPVQTDTDLQSNKWSTMNLVELERQRNLICDNINHLHSMGAGSMASPSIQTIFHALQLGLNDITKLIDAKTNNRV